MQQHSIQCVLVINIFNEKIFVFLWFWYHFLTLVSVLGLLYWTIVSLAPFCRRWFIVQHLNLADIPFDYHEQKTK
uniref:Innexin n=1 Tax=Romanomermis culicivorax TaxID=13658 RepID=A0A915JW20_ROMCU